MIGPHICAIHTSLYTDSALELENRVRVLGMRITLSNSSDGGGGGGGGSSGANGDRRGYSGASAQWTGRAARSLSPERRVGAGANEGFKTELLERHAQMTVVVDAAETVRFCSPELARVSGLRHDKLTRIVRSQKFQHNLLAARRGGWSTILLRVNGFVSNCVCIQRYGLYSRVCDLHYLSGPPWKD